MNDLDVKLDFEKMNGLVPAIVQEYRSGEVLMLAFMDESAWRKTLLTGTATYYSRSRKKLWVKGETSGNIQKIKEIRIDCDDDTVLLKVEQIGPGACHTGHRTCFFRVIENGSVQMADDIDDEIKEKPAAGAPEEADCQ